LTLTALDGHNARDMRYRRSSVRYVRIVRSGRLWPLGDVFWHGLLVEAPWQPEADTYETATTLEIVVDLAGVEEDDFELQLYEDAIVIAGSRRLPACREATVYHAAGIRRGPFKLELPLPAAVDNAKVQARHERGLLRITLSKHSENI
jgi:HSP20 family molecular chaperone IbpA